MSNLITYTYEDNVIDFDVRQDKLMVNATEMAKIFSKKVEDFFRLEQTKSFIKSALDNGNSRFLDIVTENDMYYKKQGSGTWMHRLLALKFAAWLNPDFELWVFSTIDQILFGHHYRIREALSQSEWRRNRIAELKEELSENDMYVELSELERTERRESRKLRKMLDNQREEVQPSLFENSPNIQ